MLPKPIGSKPAPVTLKAYVRRLKTDMAMIEKYENGSDEYNLLAKRIARHKEDIIAYVLTDRFQYQLDNLNL